MFWIHGGGYTAGASSEPRHNGDFLPLKGVVLVTINYRLGVFGFLATADLAKEANGAAGNYGLLDMVAALQWVKANIGRLRRRSGQCDHLRRERRLLCRQHADGLAAGPGTLSQGHRRERRRPSAIRHPTGSLESREEEGGEWVASLGVNSLESCALCPRKDSRCRQGKHINGIPPYVDGRVLTEPVETTYAAGRQAHVPLLAGWNRDENSSWPSA